VAKPPVRCSRPGCNRLNCTEHGKRPSARQRGYTSRWEKFRAAFLAEHSRCEANVTTEFGWYGRGVHACGEPATEVDHIDGRGPFGPRGYDESNLQALCKRHHSQKTRWTTGWDE